MLCFCDCTLECLKIIIRSVIRNIFTSELIKIVIDFDSIYKETFLHKLINISN